MVEGDDGGCLGRRLGVGRLGIGDWLVYNSTYSVGGTDPRPAAIVRLGFGASGPYLARSGLGA